MIAYRQDQSNRNPAWAQKMDLNICQKMGYFTSNLNWWLRFSSHQHATNKYFTVDFSITPDWLFENALQDLNVKFWAASKTILVEIS